MRKRLLAVIATGMFFLSPVYVLAADIDSMTIDELRVAYYELEEKYNELLGKTGETKSDTESKSGFQYSQDGFTYKYLENKVMDIDGVNYVFVFFEYSNDSGETSTPYYSLSIKAYQNGVQIDPYMSIQEGVPEADMAFKDVKTGTTVNIALKFALSDDSPVSIELSPMVAYDDTEIGEFTFDLTK